MFNKLFKLAIFLAFGLIILLNFPKRETQKEYYYRNVNRVKLSSFKGLVIDKYADKKDHSKEKIIIKTIDNQIEFIPFYEKELYQLIKKGDSVLKKSNYLKLRIKNQGLDTMYQFKFDNIKGFEKYDNISNGDNTR